MTSDMLYQKDLSFVHIEGYGFHWENAAPAILRFFKQHGIEEGTVVDLGCGGGQWLERLVERGYEVCGIDVSARMIDAAKKRVPSARFILGSFSDVELPPCDAVTSLGEPINYLGQKRAIRRTFRRVYQALRPGGMFVFDAREPARKPVAPRTVARTGDGWACISEIVEKPEQNSLVRHITTFRQVGKLFRRAEETHSLKVYPQAETSAWLREVGFRVRRYPGYDEYRFPPGQIVFLAEKPGC